MAKEIREIIAQIGTNPEYTTGTRELGEYVTFLERQGWIPHSIAEDPTKPTRKPRVSAPSQRQPESTASTTGGHEENVQPFERDPRIREIVETAKAKINKIFERSTAAESRIDDIGESLAP